MLVPEEQLARWEDAAMAAACVLVDGPGLGGVRLRGRPGPVRDLWLEEFRSLLPSSVPLRKIPLHCSESRLLGGLNLAATLRAGRPVGEVGLLAQCDGGLALLAMAERAGPSLIAPLSSVLDEGLLRVEREGMTAVHPCRIAVVALDEGVDDEAIAPQLAERLGLELDLTPVAMGAVDSFPFTSKQLAAARERLAGSVLDDEQIQRICAMTLALGVESPRAALLAMRLGRVLLALSDGQVLGEEDFGRVLRLCLLPRATRLPQSQPDDLDQQSVPETAESQQSDDNQESQAPTSPPADGESGEGRELDPADQERLMDAAKAVLPADLLMRLAAGASRSRRPAPAGKSGASQRHKLRGRPMGSLPGDPRSGSRIDLLATLRTAAPWQKLREPARGGARVRVKPEDFRVVRFRQRAQSVTVFVVDASGSSALYRLAEAKGAVELLLADCYVRRDEVALIAFRGNHAELLLPPTRSLVRAKRSLSALPGGGGTPLGAAIDATAGLLEMLEQRGATPAYVMLTDGRANVCRDGRTGREAAMDDAMAAAKTLRERVSASGMVIDTSPRPHRSADRLAAALGAQYQPLPNADAAQLQAVVRRVAA